MDLRPERVTVRALFVPPPARAWFGNRKIHNIIKQSIKAPLVILHCLNIWQICSLLNDVQVRVNVDEIYLLSVFKLFFSFTPRAVRQSPAPPRSANASAQVRRREQQVRRGEHAGAPTRARRCAEARLRALAECWRRTDASSRGCNGTRTKPVEWRTRFHEALGKKRFPRPREFLESCFVATSKQIFKYDFSQRPGRKRRKGVSLPLGRSPWAAADVRAGSARLVSESTNRCLSLVMKYAYADPFIRRRIP